jgi:hypothetical protein
LQSKIDLAASRARHHVLDATRVALATTQRTLLKQQPRLRRRETE